MSKDNNNWIITLVHGTWGRGIFPKDRYWRKGKVNDDFLRNCRWFEAGSLFRRRIKDHLDIQAINVDLKVFKWCGSNSILKRDEAAKHLAEQLESQKKENPNSHQIVIGHSHGGNIAVRATSYLPEDFETVSLVTLATPFVELFAPKFWQPTVEKRLLFATFVFGLIVVANYLFPSMIVGSFIAGLLLVFLFTIAEFEFNNRSFEPFRSESLHDLTRASSLRTLEIRRDNILILRGIDDEANFALAIGAATNWVTKNSLKILITLLVGTPMFWFKPVFISEVFEPTWLAMTAFGIAATSLAAISISKSVFGRELFFSFLDVEVSVNSSPDTIFGVSTHTLVRRTGETRGSRHSLYDEPNCAETIVAWLTEALDNRKPYPERDRRRLRYKLVNRIKGKGDEPDTEIFEEIDLS